MKKKKDEKTRSVLRLRVDLFQKLKHLLVDMGSTQEDLIEQLVEAAVKSHGAILKPPPEVPPNDALIKKLRVILASGDEEAIRAVSANVDLFFSRLRPANGSKAR